MTALAALRLPRRAPSLGVVVALALLLVVNAPLTPGFFELTTLFSIGVQAVTTMLVGAGMTLVIATGGVDLSVGSVMAVASAVAATLLPHGVAAAIAGGLLVAVATGALNGIFIARFGILPIIVTLATMIMGRGAAQVIVAGNPLIVFTNPAFEVLGKGHIGPVPVQVVVAAAALFAVAAVVRWTPFGRYVLAVGGNERAARLAGVPIARVIVIVYATSGLLAGVAGLIETARLGASDAGTIGNGVELDAIVAAVVGGTPLSGGRARILGTVAGALLMSILNATFAMHLVAPAWSLVVKAALLIVAVYTQQRGD